MKTTAPNSRRIHAIEHRLAWPLTTFGLTLGIVLTRLLEG